MAETKTARKQKIKKRMGAIGIKLGMVSYYDSWGKRIAATALHLDDCTVLRSFPVGHWTTIQEAGLGQKSRNGMNPAQLKMFEDLGVQPKRHVMGFSVSSEALMPPGTKIGASHFLAGQYVNLKATSIGKGFQGAMKRWGFHGMPASHGCSLSHRALGATGGRNNASKVFPGKKMAGRMGGKSATMNSVLVLRVDPELNTIIVAGSVPGHKGCAVRISDSLHKKSLKCPSNYTKGSPTDEGKQNGDCPNTEITKPQPTDCPASSTDTLIMKQVNQ